MRHSRCVSWSRSSSDTRLWLKVPRQLDSLELGILNWSVSSRLGVTCSVGGLQSVTEGKQSLNLPL